MPTMETEAARARRPATTRHEGLVMNLNPIVFALRHPITVMVAIAALVVGSALAVLLPPDLGGMKKDIFPALNLPVIYVAQPYGGMDPAQMEGLITNYYEY